MIMDWNQYHKDIGARAGGLAKLSPDTIRWHQTLSTANSKTTAHGEKTRQLISLPSSSPRAATAGSSSIPMRP